MSPRLLGHGAAIDAPPALSRCHHGTWARRRDRRMVGSKHLSRWLSTHPAIDAWWARQARVTIALRRTPRSTHGHSKHVSRGEYRAGWLARQKAADRLAFVAKRCRSGDGHALRRGASGPSAACSVGQLNATPKALPPRDALGDHQPTRSAESQARRRAGRSAVSVAHEVASVAARMLLEVLLMIVFGGREWPGSGDFSHYGCLPFGLGFHFGALGRLALGV